MEPNYGEMTDQDVKEEYSDLVTNACRMLGTGDLDRAIKMLVEQGGHSRAIAYEHSRRHLPIDRLTLDP